MRDSEKDKKSIYSRFYLKKIIYIFVISISSILIAVCYQASLPFVSVVMCVYNGAQNGDLHRSIPSILNQSFQDFEFIIVEDGSVDNSWEILQEYARQDSRIRLIKNDKNRGISYSRNLGNKMARGKYIMIMDQDDESLPHRVLKQAAFMEKQPWLDVVATPSLTPAPWDTRYDSENIKFLLFFNNNYGHPNLMIKRSFLTDNDIEYNMDYKCANDYDMLLQIRDKGGDFGTTYEALFKYNGANYSKGENSPCRTEVFTIMKKWCAGIEATSVADLMCQVSNRLVETKAYHHLFAPGFLEYKQKVVCAKVKEEKK